LDPAFARPEAVALRAVATGSATPDQQRLAFAAIRQKACMEDQPSYVQGDYIASAFNEGRRFVGISLRNAVAAPLTDFPEVKHG